MATDVAALENEVKEFKIQVRKQEKLVLTFS